MKQFANKIFPVLWMGILATSAGCPGIGGGTKPDRPVRNFSSPGNFSGTSSSFSPSPAVSDSAPVQNFQQTEASSKKCNMPESFVHLKSVDPSIQQDMRYATTQNVFGNKPLPGYSSLGNDARASGCVLDRKVADSLKSAQSKLKKSNPDLSLMVYDCFRPEKAQTHMKKYNSDGNAVAQGVSNHSRGLAVDITIVDLSGGQDRPLDMGSDFDEFDKAKYTGSDNQKKLRALMSSMGGCWKPHNGEWWHFVYTCNGQAGAQNFDIPSYDSCGKGEEPGSSDDQLQQSPGSST